MSTNTVTYVAALVAAGGLEADLLFFAAKKCSPADRWSQHVENAMRFDDPDKARGAAADALGALLLRLGDGEIRALPVRRAWVLA